MIVRCLAVAAALIATGAAAQPLSPEAVSYDYRAVHEVYDATGALLVKQVHAGGVRVTANMRARERDVVSVSPDEGMATQMPKAVGIDTADAFYLLPEPDGTPSRYARPAGGFAETDDAAIHATHTVPDPIRFAYTAGLWTGGEAGRVWEIGASLAPGETSAADASTGWQVRTGTDTKAGRPRVLWVLASKEDGTVTARSTVTYQPSQPLLPSAIVQEQYTRNAKGEPAVVARTTYTFHSYRLDGGAQASTPDKEVHDYLLPRLGGDPARASMFFVEESDRGGPRLGKLSELAGGQ